MKCSRQACREEIKGKGYSLDNSVDGPREYCFKCGRTIKEYDLDNKIPTVIFAPAKTDEESKAKLANIWEKMQLTKQQ